MHPRHRAPPRSRGDRRARHRGPHDRHRAGRMLRDGVRLLQVRHDRGVARARPGRRDGSQALHARQHRLHLPGRRRSRVHRTLRDGLHRVPRREHHDNLHQQRDLRNDWWTDGADLAHRAGHADFAVRTRPEDAGNADQDLRASRDPRRPGVSRARRRQLRRARAPGEEGDPQGVQEPGRGQGLLARRGGLDMSDELGPHARQGVPVRRGEDDSVLSARMLQGPHGGGG